MSIIAIISGSISTLIGVEYFTLYLLGGQIKPIGLIVGVLGLIFALAGLLFGDHKKVAKVASIFSIIGIVANYFVISIDYSNVIEYTIQYLFKIL